MRGPEDHWHHCPPDSGTGEHGFSPDTPVQCGQFSVCVCVCILSTLVLCQPVRKTGGTVKCYITSHRAARAPRWLRLYTLLPRLQVGWWDLPHGTARAIKGLGKKGGMMATRAGAGGTRALHGGVDRQNPALGSTCCRARGDLYNFTRVIGKRVERRA